MERITKRLTVKIYDRAIDAWDCQDVLRKAGVDVKTVTKHAVQIAPAHAELAKAALLAESKRRAEQPWPPQAHTVDNLETLGVGVADQMSEAGEIEVQR